MNPTIAHLGPKGSFSEEAAYKFSASGILLPCNSFSQVLGKTRDGTVQYGVVPTENIHGGRVDIVYALIPELRSTEIGKSLYIVGEEYLRINQSILGKIPMDLSGIKTIVSHQQGTLQCSQLIEQYGWKVETTSSTSAAAEIVAKSNDPTMAAIASPRAAEINGLVKLMEDAANIECDEQGHRIKNVTRFAMLATSLISIPLDTPATTLLEFDVEQNHPGDLRNVLNCFADNEIDILTMHTYNEHFRMKKLICEVSGNAMSEQMQNALHCGKAKHGKTIQILGCYATRDYRLAA
jgi:prephenate dehydratase